MPDRLEMRAARLDLLRQRMHVAEAALERAAREDRVDAGGLVGQVRDLDRAMDRVGAGEPHAGAIGEPDRLHLAGLRVDRGQRVDADRRAPSRAAPPCARHRPAPARCRRAATARAAPCARRDRRTRTASRAQCRARRRRRRPRKGPAW